MVSINGVQNNDRYFSMNGLLYLATFGTESQPAIVATTNKRFYKNKIKILIKICEQIREGEVYLFLIT